MTALDALDVDLLAALREHPAPARWSCPGCCRWPAARCRRGSTGSNARV
ncbi:hypothetical protein ACFQV8_30625 [Pseudonocardia benzenivorans]